MLKRTILATVAVAALMSFGTYGAYAKGATESSEYEVTVIQDKGEFSGCLSANQTTSVGILGVAQSALVIFSSQEFNGIAKGSKVSGTWSVDGGKSMAFTDDSTGKDTVTIALSSESQLTQLKDGNTATISVGKDEVNFDLSGFTKGFNALSDCMKAHKAS